MQKRLPFAKNSLFVFLFYTKTESAFPLSVSRELLQRDAAELSQDKGAPYQIQVSKSFEKKCKHQRRIAWRVMDMYILSFPRESPCNAA